MQLLKDYDRASDLKNKLANKTRIVVFNDAMRKRRVREIASKNLSPIKIVPSEKLLESSLSREDVYVLGYMDKLKEGGRYLSVS